MKMPYFCVAAGLIAIGAAVPAAGQSLAWQSSVTANVPTGAAIGTANVGLSHPLTAPVVALVTFDTGLYELFQYRAVATDPISGQPLWSRDLGSECTTQASDYSFVTALADGDSIATVQGQSSSRLGFTCIARLRASDGQILWSRTFGT